MLNREVQDGGSGFELHSKEQELHRKIDEEFAEFANQTFETIRQLYRKLETLGLAKIQEGEDLVARKKQLYDKCNFNERVGTLTNNFYMWWPGGYYRKALEERKKETEEDLQAIQADEQLVVDLDTIIAEAGYKNLDSLIQEMYTKDDGRDKRTSAIADVFLKMRALGYDRGRLRK